MAKKAPWPSEIWPLKPVRRLRPSSAIGQDEHLRALIEMVARGDEREGEREDSDRDGGKSAERAVGVDHGHTLATSRRPNRPDGRQTSTAMMIASATESLTSSPTT